MAKVWAKSGPRVVESGQEWSKSGLRVVKSGQDRAGLVDPWGEGRGGQGRQAGQAGRAGQAQGWAGPPPLTGSVGGWNETVKTKTRHL